MRRKHTIGTIYHTNLDGDVELLEKNGKIAKVRFLNTNYEREVNIDNLVVGKCRDHSITNRKFTEDTFPNKLMSSNKYGDFILLKKNGNNCIIQFVLTGYTRTCLYENIKNGKVSDPYYPSNHGKGYVGEYAKNYYSDQAMQLWRNMLKRCYCTKDTRGYFLDGVTVSERWLCFSNFLSDLPELEDFSLWLQGQKEGSERYNLDKDFICPGNKVYCKELCMFLPESLNKRLGGMHKKVDSI